MSKKHYMAIAKAIVRTRQTVSTEGEKRAVDTLVAYLVGIMAADNPAFDREKFAKAIR